MVREDIVAGLKNALDRGYSFQAAKRSLLNAGYSAEDVEEAGNYLNAGAILPMHETQQIKKPADSVLPGKTKQPQPIQQQSQQMQQIQQTQQAQQQPQQIQQTQQAQQQTEQPKSPGFFSRNWKIILLLIVLIILIILFVVVLLFRDTIAGWFL